MSCMHKHLKLPKANNIDMVKCVKITMSDEKEYTVKVDDLVGIQFVKDDKNILVRRGRIKDLVVVNRRELSAPTDNVSRIILDCSEQFTVKIVEIKFTDVIAIGGIDDEFEDYSDRIKELEPNFMHHCDHGSHIPTREHGFTTKEEMLDIIEKHGEENVVGMSEDGVFEDLVKSSYTGKAATNSNAAITTRGMALRS